MSIEQNKTNGFTREYNKEKREKKEREREREKRERERERERKGKRERERERKGKRERETCNRMNGVKRVVKSKKIRVGLTRFFENLIQK